MKCNKTRILLVDDMDINLVIGIGLVKPTWHHTLCLELELQARKETIINLDKQVSCIETEYQRVLQALAVFKETSIG